MAYIVQRNSVRNDLDRVWESLLGDRSPSPAVDIVEEEGEYRIEADLPGLSENDVEVKIEDRVLLVSSVSNKDQGSDGKKYLVRERRGRDFQRSFVVPKDADVTAVEAAFKNGVLTVRLPKLPEVQPRSIEIKHG